jgi:polygalacturonase
VASVFNVVDSGAVGDGVTKNTQAIAEAIEAAAAGRGGKVLIPPGTYLTGPITLRSRVELHVEAGATVVFSRDYADYPLVETSYEGLAGVRCTSPINGRDLREVVISGKGVFDGQGQAWRPVKRSKMTPQQWAELLAAGGVTDASGQVWWPSEQARDGRAYLEQLRASGRPVQVADYEPVRAHLRPCLMELGECRDVLLDGPTFQNSPGWNLHPLRCDRVTVRNVTVLNPWWSQNGDGLDLDSCRDCLVTDSHFDVGDDAICIKSGRDEAGRRLGRPSENITVRNCTVAHGHGGVVIGSEMSGGVRNIDVANCTFDGTDTGLRFKTTRGRGGIVENVRISNITMANIRNEAILFDMYYAVRQDRPEPFSERTPQFRNFHIANIVCRSAGRAITLRGLPERPIEAVTIENAILVTQEGVSLSHAKDITFIGVQVDCPELPVLQCSNVENLVLRRFSGKTTG